MSDAPVLIVGAGPVGLTGAVLLARHGVPSVVLEARPERVQAGSRAICVQRDVLDVLERAGVGRAVADAGVTWYSGRIFHGEREVVAQTLPEPQPGLFPPFVNTPQNVVERLLEAVVDAEPLIDLRYGSQVVSLAQDDDGVVLGLAGGGSVAGTHCIAADGSRSTVRALLGLPFEGMSFDDRFLITDLRTKLDQPEPERRFWFDPPFNPGRQVLLHPQPDSVWRIDWQVPRDFDLAAETADGRLDARIRAVVGDADYDLLWASSYTFHQRRVPTMHVDRVLLAGDAAHLMSPFGARGMNSGLADVENAAWKLAATRQGWAGPALLPTYDAERGAAAEENLRVTATTMRFLVPADDAQRAHRLATLTAARTDDSAKAAIDSGKFSEPFWYLDSPLTTPAPADALAAFPRGANEPRPPLPGVLCPDVPLPGAARLRDLFGLRFSVLAAAGVAVPPVEATVVRVPDEVATALDLAHDQVAVVRPDGYLAAVVGAEEVGPAVARAAGF
ncbi:pentachlorophenol monooxygenase [Actinokineospora bangkokensis]|uniref:Pentachlorophenol monooxygenase n=2 Tax=Actinokineospora bangkokensis TaxID=1193682 RepID=A0A1Q9LEV2_9PSEU|nr:pentachlorophenol monooxygenase [Actinokineospora bangkokensis]